MFGINSYYLTRAILGVFTAGLFFLAITSIVAEPLQAKSDGKDKIRKITVLYLYTFAKTVTWPGASNVEERVVGVAGDPQLVTIANEMIQENPKLESDISFRSVTLAQVAKSPPHVLFLDLSLSDALPNYLEAIGSDAVLTVGMMPYFTERGGMVNLTPVGRKINYEINLTAIDAAGLNADELRKKQPQ